MIMMIEREREREGERDEDDNDRGRLSTGVFTEVTSLFNLPISIR